MHAQNPAQNNYSVLQVANNSGPRFAKCDSRNMIVFAFSHKKMPKLDIFYNFK